MTDPSAAFALPSHGDAAPAVPNWLLNATVAVELAPPEPSYLSGSYSRIAGPEPGGAKAEPVGRHGACEPTPGGTADAVHAHSGLRLARGRSEGKEDSFEAADAAADIDARPVVARAEEERGQRISAGFRIEEMTMRNGDSGAVVWRAANLGAEDLFAGQLEAVLPASLLSAGSVMRSITFSSREVMKDFYMVQRMYLSGQLLEEDEFSFGFVIPGSTNTLEQEVEADEEAGTLPAEVLSGNLLVQTQFFDKAVLVGSAVVRIVYDSSR